MLACERVATGSLSFAEAADMLSISARQMCRSMKRYEESGAQGVAHAARGQTSNRAADPEAKAAAIALIRERYADFGPTLASEGLVFSDETLRRWMADEGLWQVSRSRTVHRSARPRKEYFAELVQMDGSFHDWFEGRRGTCCLMQMVDDAPGKSCTPPPSATPARPASSSWQSISPTPHAGGQAA